jgi:hypothetical protein
VKRAALHELIEFVTTSGSCNAAAAAGVNNNNKVKDISKDGDDKDSNDGSSETPSLISSAFESTFYQEMVNTVSFQSPPCCSRRVTFLFNFFARQTKPNHWLDRMTCVCLVIPSPSLITKHETICLLGNKVLMMFSCSLVFVYDETWSPVSFGSYTDYDVWMHDCVSLKCQQPNYSSNESTNTSTKIL